MQLSVHLKAMCVAGAIALAPVSVSAQDPAHAVVFDTYMTPAAGAHTTLAVQSLLASIEDRWLPGKIGDERRRPALALGILYRTGKFFALDLPQDHFLMVAAHEVFGHGARFRELGDGIIRYGFDVPIPYGAGEAFTSFNGEFPIMPLASLTVSAAGIEAQHALADAIAAGAVTEGRLHYRESWLYFESRLTAMTYILSASPHAEEGHDVADYLSAFQDACTAPCRPSTRRSVQRRALMTLGDPLLYYSLYGFTASYIGSGNTTMPVPMIPVGHLRLLPSLGFNLAPYGTEWVIRTASTKVAASARIGDTGARRTFGFSGRVSDIARLRGVPIAASFDLWRQPPVLADKTSDPQKIGAAAAALFVVPLPPPLHTGLVRGLHVSVGYKSEGYIPGEQLSGGLLFRAGLQLR